MKNFIRKTARNLGGRIVNFSDSGIEVSFRSREQADDFMDAVMMKFPNIAYAVPEDNQFAFDTSN